MAFLSEFEPGVELSPQHWVIAVMGGKLLLHRDRALPLHRQHELENVALSMCQVVHMGRWLGESCFAVEFADASLATEESLGADNLAFDLASLRSQLDKFDEQLFNLAGRALQLLHWHSYHRFCGSCGAATQLSSTERALQCRVCATLYYPKIAPCAIGVIVHGDRCLLARNARFRDGLFSAIAGFIEPGESVEEALRREIREEVGVRVGKLEYIRSQSWPFPSQLMLGYIAHYESGEIEVDGQEIVEAAWFSAQNLPQIPPPQTISGQLIQTFVERACASQNPL